MTWYYSDPTASRYHDAWGLSSLRCEHADCAVNFGLALACWHYRRARL